MKLSVTMWINFILSVLWLAIAVIRLTQDAPIAVTILSFGASILFLVLGLLYARTIKKQKTQK